MESNKNGIESIKVLFGDFLDSINRSNSEMLNTIEELKGEIILLNGRIGQYEVIIKELEQRVTAIEGSVIPDNIEISSAEPAIPPAYEQPGESVEDTIFILDEEVSVNEDIALPEDKDLPAESSNPENPPQDDLFSRSANTPAGKQIILEAVKPDWYDWEVDYPAPYIENISDGIGFNDRLLFLKELFNENTNLFGITLTRLNGMESFKEAVDYLREKFPQWNEQSDEVYRFYMNVRRKLRK